MANVPVPEPKSIRTSSECQSEQVKDSVAFRLDVAEVSMGGIVDLNFRRIAVIFSHLLKLVILPANHTSYRAPQDEWHSREHQADNESPAASPSTSTFNY
jgi:hypothetical protein